MWARMLNILKYVWQNPIVQFACFTVIEGVYLILRKKTGKTFSQYRMEKKSSSDINEAVADMIIIDNKEEKPETEVEVVAEEAKPKRKSARKKKEVILEEELKQKKTRKRTVKTLESGDKVAEPVKPKRKRAVKRVAVKEAEPATEEKK